MGNKRATAIELNDLGDVFKYPGRYGAAVDSRAEAVKIFQGDRRPWLVVAKAPFIVRQRAERGGSRRRGGHAAGRSAPPRSRAGQRRSDRGDPQRPGRCTLLRGRFQGRPGAICAGGSPCREGKASSDASAGAIEPGQSRSRGRTVADLSGRADEAGGTEADGLGLKYEAIQCSLLAAATDLRLKDSARARALSESALPKAERLGAPHSSGRRPSPARGDRGRGSESGRSPPPARMRHDNSSTPSARTPGATRCSAAPDLKRILDQLAAVKRPTERRPFYPVTSCP